MNDCPELTSPAMDWATPVFRTVSTASGRHALRLEQVFWDALQVLANQNGRRPNDLVREMIDRALASNINVSRAVRSSIVRQLLDERNRLTPLATSAAIVQLLQLAPSPSFALDRQKRLVGVNKEFVRYLGGMAARTPSPESAQLSLDRPIEQLLAEIAPGTSLECEVLIKIDVYERSTRARIVVPPPEPSDVLIAFILY